MDQKIIKIVKRHADKVCRQMPVEMMILFGSHVRGKPTKNSDIDVAVVVDKIRGDYLQISVNLFDMVRDVDKRIEPVLLSKSHDRAGFLDSVLKQGKIIYPAKTQSE